MSREGSLGDSTRCVHGGERPVATEPAVTPIVQSSIFLTGEAYFREEERGEPHDQYLYTRYGNPTLAAVERRLARLEGAAEAALFASGMAAMHAGVMALARPGSRVVGGKHLYGGNAVLLESILPDLGFETGRVDLTDPVARERGITEDVSLVFCESLSNPTLEVADLPRIAARAHAVGAALMVDATFATPLLQHPLELGADLVAHSTTKYLNGHSDHIGGVVCGAAEPMAKVRSLLLRVGGCADPHAAWLLERGMKTLALRLRAQCDNAGRLARVLQAHPRVGVVNYPGLESHPTHGLAFELLRGHGAMLSFQVEGGDGAAEAFLRRLELALEAPSLGSVETLVSMPRYTSHTHLSASEREAEGILPGLVRVSVGIEDFEDLERDFVAALDDG